MKNKLNLLRIDKYIIRKFLGTYIFMITLILSISVVFDINEKIDKFMSNSAPLKEIIFNYYINFVPYYANLFSPLFIFLAVIFFTSKMASSSEIIALLSNGVSFKRLLKPYMVSAAVIAVFSFVMGSFIIPPANETRIDFEQKYIDPRKRKTGDRDIQFKVAEGTIVYFGNFDLESKTGYNFSIDHFDGLEEKITHGTTIDTIIQIVPNDFIVAKTDQQMMTTPQLLRHVRSQKKRGLGNIQAFQIEYHSRYASIFSAFILTIIGASLSARKVKGGMGLNIGIGLALSMAYILFMTISSSFAVKGSMSPFVAAWIPNIVFIGIAFFLYKKAPN